jgi:two-component system chemotaxis response regulator CheY
MNDMNEVPNSAPNCNVLIVDDSPAMRQMIGRVLKISGFPMADMVQAGDGAEALEVLGRRPVDLVLTDINMPRMNGEQLLRKMSEDGGLSRIPVVVISTDATDTRMKQMMELGARGYLVKPFQPASLRSELERVWGLAKRGEE